VSDHPRVAVVVLAAGSGARSGAATNKVLLPLAGLPVFAWSLRWIEPLEYVDHVVVVIREEDRGAVTQTVQAHFPGLDVRIVVGGDSRHASEWNALQTLAEDIDTGRIGVVAIHDSARPLAGTELFEQVIAAAAHGGALPVRAQNSLLVRDVVEHAATGPADTGLVSVQTPQAFHAPELLTAYLRAERDHFTATDTASCIERYTDLEIHGVPCAATNMKITFPEDIAIAERLLGGP
jgi:2-C-methyl-D-erythritol 4-phosphate cytidylyltransferase